MARSRMFGDDEPPLPEQCSPRTTIVGGRPPDAGAQLPPVPIGLQRLLRLAAASESFRRELCQRRGALADASGVALTASERAILVAVPEEQLRSMIEHLPREAPERVSSLRQVAASAVLLLGGAAIGESAACGPPATPPVTDAAAGTATATASATTSATASTAAAPDAGPDAEAPPVRPDTMSSPPAGIQPDLPPPRPEVSHPTRGIRPDF